MVIMYWPILACSVFLLNALLAEGKTGCPEPKDIAPCTCIRLPSVRLTCSGLKNSEKIRRVFANSEQYSFDQLYIKSSAFQEIPSEIFEKVTVKELYFQNSVFQKIFSELKKDNKNIYKLEIDSSVVKSTLTAQDFYWFVNLKELSVFNTIVSTLSKNFGYNLPENIKKIVLRNTGTKSISEGTLNHLPHLDEFAVEKGNLKTLTRDIFPHPFYGRIISFNGNRITSIPKDMFTEMPNLQSLSMMNNAISVLPESAFAGRTLKSLKFEGNRLQCDCQFLWLIENKPEVLGGTCSSPRKFAGRALQDLMPAQFSCSN